MATIIGRRDAHLAQLFVEPTPCGLLLRMGPFVLQRKLVDTGMLVAADGCGRSALGIVVAA
jgi:hypothetical protein